MAMAHPSVLLAKHGLAPSRRRGQNFLSDWNVARKVVSAVNAGPDDAVLEIGPGLGAITVGLLEAAGRVVAIEFDTGLVRALAEELGSPDGLTLIAGDALDFDIAALGDELGIERLVVAGNLPYNITSPLLERLIRFRSRVSRAVVMVQAEVAARLTAGREDRDYSALSVVVGFHANVRPLFSVGRSCFFPKPKVDSRVVEITFEGAPARRADPATFYDVVHAAFGKRRKMLRRSLEDLMMEADVTAAALETASGVDLSLRGERLSIEQFEDIAIALDAARTA